MLETLPTHVHDAFLSFLRCTLTSASGYTGTQNVSAGGYTGRCVASAGCHNSFKLTSNMLETLPTHVHDAFLSFLRCTLTPASGYTGTQNVSAGGYTGRCVASAGYHNSFKLTSNMLETFPTHVHDAFLSFLRCTLTSASGYTGTQNVSAGGYTGRCVASAGCHNSFKLTSNMLETLPTHVHDAFLSFLRCALTPASGYTGTQNVSACGYTGRCVASAGCHNSFKLTSNMLETLPTHVHDAFLSFLRCTLTSASGYTGTQN